MNAALLMMVGAFFVTLQVIATVDGAEIRTKSIATEDAVMAESDILTRQRRGAISWECTAKCAGYWICIVKGALTSESCDYPSGCECKCFASQKC
uniref:Uncharacterized protein n=1 Tax=Plectus sambesii TaxID=2011161 RepID=A0A914WM32_9BILA